MKRNLVWGKSLGKGKRMFAAAAALMMLTLCFVSLSTNVEAASTGIKITENFEGNHGFAPSVTPARSWLVAANSTTQSHSPTHSEKLSFSGAPNNGTDYGTGMMSKLYTNMTSAQTVSLWMYCSAYSHDGTSYDSMSSGIEIALYNARGTNYANYTYWLACWYQGTNNKTPGTDTKVIYGKPTLNTWIEVHMNPSSDFSINWSQYSKLKIELFVSCSGTNGDSFTMYYDDPSFAEQIVVSENFEGTHHWSPYKSPVRSWMIAQNSTIQYHSSNHSEQVSFSGAPANGTDSGNAMMYKYYNASSISTLSLWMYVDQYSHDGNAGDSMCSGIALCLYNSTGGNYVSYSYWLACWSGSTNNKTPGTNTKVIFGKPTMSTWLYLNLNPNAVWNINWDQCSKVKLELFTSCSYAYGDSFRAYFDDLSFVGGGSG